MSISQEMIKQEETIKREVWNTLRELNDCWTKGDGSGLVNYFHKDMVAITPTKREDLWAAMRVSRTGWGLPERLRSPPGMRETH
jgi:hypothetical protein